MTIIFFFKQTDYWANPVICQDQYDSSKYFHIGFLNIHIKNFTFDPFELQLTESLILIFQQEKIYKEIDDYFIATKNNIL